MNRNDLLWKGILEDLFSNFLTFFIPNAEDVIAFERGFEFLDKELEQLFPPDDDSYKPRHVDKLVKVFTREGHEHWVLIHVEVQGQVDSQFSQRMFSYYSQLYDRYACPITAFAILTDRGGNHGDRRPIVERKGLEQGIEKGLKQGGLAEKQKLVRNLLTNTNFTADQIAVLVGMKQYT